MAQIITIKPNLENCDTFSQYEKSTPGEFSLQENPILYGGGRSWILKPAYTEAFKYIALAHQKPIEVDVFVLNTSLILWLNDYSKGIEIRYQAIQSHILKKTDLGVMGLLLSIHNVDLFENNSYHLTELYLVPTYGENERHYNHDIDGLFTFTDFGINRGDKMVLSTFYSIGKCSNLHLIPGLENRKDEGEENLSGSDIHIYDEGYDNSGNADDIDLNYFEDVNDKCFAVEVDEFNDEYQRGVTRRRNDLHADFSSSPGRRESPKRIRC